MMMPVPPVLASSGMKMWYGIMAIAGLSISLAKLA